MLRGELILAAPSRRARNFAEADMSLIGVNLHQKKRRSRVRPAAAALDRKLRLDRHADGDGFDASNCHRSPRQHLHRMLESEPEEERIDPQDDPDEQQPPDAEIFDAAVSLPLLE